MFFPELAKSVILREHLRMKVGSSTFFIVLYFQDVLSPIKEITYADNL